MISDSLHSGFMTLHKLGLRSRSQKYDMISFLIFAKQFQTWSAFFFFFLLKAQVVFGIGGLSSTFVSKIQRTPFPLRGSMNSNGEGFGLGPKLETRVHLG